MLVKILFMWCDRTRTLHI